MINALRYSNFGGIEQLKWEKIESPEVLAGQIRVRVTAVSINPMDWLIIGNPQMAQQFGVQLPQKFGYDFAGIVDKIAQGVTEYKVGDRVFGTTYDGAASEQIILPVKSDSRHRIVNTPDFITDEIASSLGVAGMTAANCLNTIKLNSDDTVLIGGAAGGVGVFTVQLAKIRGACVIGTSSPSTFDFLRRLGAEPIAYGDQLLTNLQQTEAPKITAAIDLYSHDVVNVALELGVPKEKITSIIMYPPLPEGIKTSTGGAATEEDMKVILEAIQTKQLVVPIAEKFSIQDYEEAIKTQMARHTHGKIVMTLS